MDARKSWQANGLGAKSANCSPVPYDSLPGGELFRRLKSDSFPRTQYGTTSYDEQGCSRGPDYFTKQAVRPVNNAALRFFGPNARVHQQVARPEEWVIDFEDSRAGGG